MAHLAAAEWTWHVGSPVTLEITLIDVQANDLSDLVWRLRDPSRETVAEVDDLSASQDGDDAVVTGELTAPDTADLASSQHTWQLHGTVSGKGPEVLGEGTLTLHPLYDELPS